MRAKTLFLCGLLALFSNCMFNEKPKTNVPKFKQVIVTPKPCTSLTTRVGYGQTCYFQDPNKMYCCIGVKEKGKELMQCYKGPCSKYLNSEPITSE